MLQDLIATLPIGIVAIMGCIVLLVDAFDETDESRHLAYLTVAGFVVALIAIYLLWGRGWEGFHTTTFGTMMVMGKFELACCALLSLVGICVALMAADQAEAEGYASGELYALIQFAVFGMMILACSTNLVTLFVGLEVMSISVYILAGIKRSSAFSAEASMKYFVLGAFATGLLLYGLAFLYGETGAFEYWEIFIALGRAGEPSAFMAIALFMIVAAFAFKIALVPFHMWTPDVYEGAPPAITALMATGVKTAAVIAMARLFVIAMPPAALGWMGKNLFDVLAVLAVLTMTVGNLVALRQKNIKRMLAYSSVAHAGYLLIGIMAAHVAAGPESGTWGNAMGAILFYLFVYALANLAAFAVIGMYTKDDEDVTLDTVAGMATAHPLGALVLAIGMFSLAGVPPTAGFFGKFALFREALVANSDAFLWLVIVAVLNSVVSVYYYLRVVVYAYMREARRERTLVRGTSLGLALLITAVGTIQVGIFPGRYLKAVDEAALQFVPVAEQVLEPDAAAPIVDLAEAAPTEGVPVALTTP